MNRPPSFPFYPKDWDDVKVRRMSYEAQGIYMRILCFMWKDSKDQCSIINNDGMISQALGISKQKWLRNKKEILFDGDPILSKKRNKLISKRLKTESQKLIEYRQMQSEKGKKSALIRGTTVKPRLNNGSTESQPKGNSSSSSSLKKNIYPQKFEEFWDFYPRKIEKKDALITWKQLKNIEQSQVITASKNYASAMESEGRDMKHIKHPKSFLNKDRWKEYIKFHPGKHKYALLPMFLKLMIKDLE